MKHQVLIVEDNEINSEMLSAILTDEYSILEAENGQVALDILEANKENIALIILDVVMPVMDGYTFLNIIKTDPVFFLIPVIIATQSDSEESEINALEQGATDYVNSAITYWTCNNRYWLCTYISGTYSFCSHLFWER